MNKILKRNDKYMRATCGSYDLHLYEGAVSATKRVVEIRRN